MWVSNRSFTVQFPEVKGKLVITHVRMFYLGHELNRPTPFVRVSFLSIRHT